jgi:hypothetical protein
MGNRHNIKSLQWKQLFTITMLLYHLWVYNIAVVVMVTVPRNDEHDVFE